MIIINFNIIFRVFHIGKCGVHHKKSECSVDEEVQTIENFYSRFQNQFFPGNFSVIRKKSPKIKLVNNGGWSDPRDHELCIQYELEYDQIIKSNVNFRLFIKDLYKNNK